MELFHGPTFAFKDVALQALGNLFEYFLLRNNKRITVVGATSGDTGRSRLCLPPRVSYGQHPLSSLFLCALLSPILITSRRLC
eukprot:1054973-Rhodomonas_salina.2